MARKLIVMFDGTWNNKKSRTNVTRMRESIATSGENDREQLCFYDLGVGTHWYDRITGGAFGPEASIIAVILCLGTAVLLLWRAAKIGRIQPPLWSRHNPRVTLSGSAATESPVHPNP